MTTVTNQTELRNALIALESEIKIGNDFEISAIINIEYPVSISSLDSTIFTLLKSASYFGNIFRIRNGGSLTLSNIILDGNKGNHPVENTTNRSLLLIAGGTLILQENAVIQNNNTYLEGGGVYLSGNASYENHFIMEANAAIRGCYARTNGGGIIAAIRNANDTVIIRHQALIEDNIANYGGGFYYRIYSEGIGNSVTIEDNPVFQNNRSNNSGAAIAIINIDNNNESISCNIPSNVQITNNTATNHGGGIYFLGTNPNDQLNIGTAQIVDNQAGGYGGAIYANGVLTNLNGTTISENSAGTGGGLYLLTNNGGSLTIDNSTIASNHAVNGASGSGGGIWINNRSTTLAYSLKITNSSISNNSATALGGGLYLLESANGLDVQIEKVNVENNTASSNGGGLLLASGGNGNISITESYVSNNVSNNYGGGIYVSNESSGLTTFVMNDTEVSGNQASVQGGGLRLASGQGILETTLENCSIKENIARTSSGGGIWCGGNNASLSLTQETSIDQNETIEGNGGGIYFNSQNGILKLNDNSKVTNNKAYQNTDVTRNSGGGIYLVPGVLIMTGNSEISGNKAKYGGGIGTAEQATVTIESGSIHDNEAIWGGGIHNQDSTVYIKDGMIYGNQATGYAPGIYNGGNLYVKDSSYNEDGVYIESQNEIVKIEDSLTPDAVVQLNNSDYISPDESKAPIVVATATDTYPVLTITDLEAFRKPPVDFERWVLYLNEDNTQILLGPVILEEYTITYSNLHGATHTNPTSYTSETPTITLTAPSYVKCKYFTGWYNENGVKVLQIKQGTTGNITLTARWDSVGCCEKIGYICLPKRRK